MLPAAVAPAAAAGGPPGWVLMALMSALAGLGPTLFRSDKGAKRLREMMQFATDPNTILQNARRFYDTGLQSPAYSTAQGNIYAGSNAASSQLASSLAERGLTTSGIGALAGATGGGATGFQLGKLNTDFWNNALQQAQELSRTQAGGISGLPPERNIGAEMFGGGLDAIGKLLAALATRTPQQTTQTNINRPRIAGMMSRPNLSQFQNPRMGGTSQFARLNPMLNNPQWSMLMRSFQ